MTSARLASCFLIAVLIGLIIAGCGSRKRQEVVDPPRRVAVMTISASERPEIYRVSGRVLHTEESVASFKTGGIIHSINIESGESFRRGDVLATLDTTEIAAIARSATERRAKLERDHRRVERLHEEKVVSLGQLQDSRTALVAAEADEQRALFNLERSMIRAPYDGLVAARMANEDEMIEAGHPLFRLVERGERLTAGLSVPARLVNSLQIGDPVDLLFDEIRHTSRGSVSEISAVADVRSGHYTVEVVYDSHPSLREGMIVRASFEGVPRRVVALPTAALVGGDKDRGKVFLAEDSVASLREINLIAFEGDSMLTEATLPEHSRVIVSGAGFLRDGARITITETGP